jgi:hypothetical protein
MPAEGALLEANDGTRLRVESVSQRVVDSVRILPQSAPVQP